MTPEEIIAATGQTNLNSAPRLILNEVLLNGDEASGNYRKRIWVDKGEGKPVDEDLGNEIATVWLKIRRKLVERGRDGGIIRSTNEHNTVNDMISLYEDGKEIFTGNAKDARIKYEGLRTVQVIYALLLTGVKEPELVRLTVKGASLGSENKPKDVMSFYDYVALYDTEPIINYVTDLGSIKETGRKTYYSMTFKQGKKVENSMPLVLENLKKVHEYCSKYDKGEVPSISAMEDTPTIEEELLAAEIPF